METASKRTCRDLALYWAQLADADLRFVQENYLNVNAMKSALARPTAMAAVAQAWATLAVTAPDD